MNSKVRALQRCLSQEMYNVSPHAVAGLELVQLFYFLEYWLEMNLTHQGEKASNSKKDGHLRMSRSHVKCNFRKS